MKVAVILIVVGAHGTVPKGLEKRLEKLEIRRRIKSIQTIALLRSARILRRVLKRLAVTQTGVKNSHKVKIIIIIITVENQRTD